MGRITQRPERHIRVEWDTKAAQQELRTARDTGLTGVLFFCADTERSNFTWSLDRSRSLLQRLAKL